LIEGARHSIEKSLYEIPTTLCFKISLHTASCMSTKYHGRVTSTPATYSEDPVFKYRSRDLLHFLRFMWVSSVPPENEGIETQNRQRLLPCTSSQIHYSI
jgi:hypothetical protein